MDMTGTQRVEAPRAVVWAGLNDVEILKQCIPGCESIEKISDTEMTAKVTLRVGPVKASFLGKVTLSDLDPPNGYTISGEGSGGAAGFAKGGARVCLAEEGSATILSYEVNAEIGGKLAQLGGRLIEGTAKKLAAEFFEKFSQVVAPSTPLAANGPTADAPKKLGWFRKLVRKVVR
jgi:carbon monoxide dehydrogenase subunit G